MNHFPSRKTLIATLVGVMMAPMAATAGEAELMQKIEALTQQLQELKAQVQAAQKSADEVKAAQTTQSEAVAELKDNFETADGKSMEKWLTIGGDYEFRMDSLSADRPAYKQYLPSTPNTPASMAAATVKNSSMYSNKFGLDLNAKATDNVTVTARLVMNKNFGVYDATDGGATYFSDRVGAFDGTFGHVPTDNSVMVDRVYANWTNLNDQDMWFSVGRRPSTDGAPKNFKNYEEKPGRGGTPSILVDYAFDGMTLGYAPEIDSLPGAYGKICYGRGFEGGFSNSIEDTDMVGVAIVPIDTDALRVWGQWNRGMNIFDSPTIYNSSMGNMSPTTNLGDIDWVGLGAMGTVKNVGEGKLNWFLDAGFSKTNPNGVTATTGASLLGDATHGKNGHALYAGLRYDLASKNSFGLEYNYGSKNWITFAPAASDAWTSKVGTRGHVYEAYMIHEFKNKPISSRTAKSFVRLGVQYYDFEYTGSNNWAGAPTDMSLVNTVPGQQMMTPLDKAYNIYATLNVKF